MSLRLTLTIDVPEGKTLTYADLLSSLGASLPNNRQPLRDGDEDTIWPDAATDESGDWPEGLGFYEVTDSERTCDRHGENGSLVNQLCTC